MKINIYELIDGAKKAKGCTVIIDVFRAFSLEAYFFGNGAEKIYPVAKLEEAYQLHDTLPNTILVGERNGVKIPDFDYGNSPSTIIHDDFTGKTIIHTTSAGTQGIYNASHASRILTGSLVNAKATAKYIKQCNPDEVSLVCMGWSGKRNTEEDELCALYIKSLLEDNPLPDIKERALFLKEQEGKKFFDPKQKDVFPEEDFWLCIDYDRFDFAIEIKRENAYYLAHKVTL